PSSSARPPGTGHCFFNAASTAWTKAGASGLTADRNRPTTSPDRLIRNFSKFHLTSPANFGSVSFDVRYRYSGQMPGPLTTTLLIIGKVTLYLEVQNCLI